MPLRRKTAKIFPPIFRCIEIKEKQTSKPNKKKAKLKFNLHICSVYTVFPPLRIEYVCVCVTVKHKNIKITLPTPVFLFAY